MWLVRRLQITCLFQLVPESPQMTVLNFVLGGGGGTIFTEGGHYSPVNNVLGGQYSLVNNVREDSIHR